MMYDFSMPKRKLITVSVQLEPETYHKFHKLSDQLNRSMAAQTRFLIEREIDDFEQTKDLGGDS